MGITHCIKQVVMQRHSASFSGSDGAIEKCCANRIRGKAFRQLCDCVDQNKLKTCIQRHPLPYREGQLIAALDGGMADSACTSCDEYNVAGECSWAQSLGPSLAYGERPVSRHIWDAQRCPCIERHMLGQWLNSGDRQDDKFLGVPPKRR